MPAIILPCAPVAVIIPAVVAAFALSAAWIVKPAVLEALMTLAAAVPAVAVISDVGVLRVATAHPLAAVDVDLAAALGTGVAVGVCSSAMTAVSVGTGIRAPPVAASVTASGLGAAMSSAVFVEAIWAIGFVLTARAIAVCFVGSSVVGCVVSVIADSVVTARFLSSFVALTTANVFAVVACIFVASTIVSAFAVSVCVLAGFVTANAFLRAACILVAFTAKDAFAKAICVHVVAQSRQKSLVHGRMYLGGVSAVVSRHAAILHLPEDHFLQELIHRSPRLF